MTTGGPSSCGAGRPNCYAFRALPAYAPALARAGFDVLNLANNHSGDFASVGNVVGYRSLNNNGLRGVTAILRATLRGNGEWVLGRLAPVRIVDPGMPVPDAAEQAHGGSATALARGLRPPRGADNAGRQRPQPGSLAVSSNGCGSPSALAPAHLRGRVGAPPPAPWTLI